MKKKLPEKKTDMWRNDDKSRKKYETTKKNLSPSDFLIDSFNYFHITRPRHAGLWLELEGLGCIGINPLLNSEAKRDQMTTRSCDGRKWRDLDNWYNSAAIGP